MSDEEKEQPAIVLDGVTAGTGSFRLGPLQAEIPRGWTTAIVGANGSGKSTLFRILLGLLPVVRGKLEVLGTSVQPGVDERYKQQIGFVAENGHPHEHSLTIAEKAAFAAFWYPGWDDQHYRRLLKRFGIDEKMKLGKLSKGMRRKAELVIVMAHLPNLLLLDEPTSGLDPIVWKMWLEEMQGYMANGNKTLLIATHVTEEVRRLADHVLFLHQGRFIAQYEKDRLFDEWRELLVRGPSDADKSEVEALRLLAGVSGVCQAAREGQDGYRVQVNGASEGRTPEVLLQACGFQVLESRRMELEDILSCMIRKEDANVEPA